MNSEDLGGIVRAVVSAIGGYFVGKGLVDAATMTTIAGGVTTIAMAVWSVWAKRSGKPAA